MKVKQHRLLIVIATIVGLLAVPFIGILLAIVGAPGDDFSHCKLGIALYKRAKYEEAAGALTKAIERNPKNATAHNYLGIARSQQGREEEGKKELEKAIALDPAYGDAQFNLAVILATQSPPDKEAARSHYRRAIDLGGEVDASLEEMIK